MLQDDAVVRFLHVGMLQHDPVGRLAFLHRTAEGKFLPQRDSFRRFHLLTVPLSPTRAAALLGGLHKHMGYDTYQVLTARQHLECLHRWRLFCMPVSAA